MMKCDLNIAPVWKQNSKIKIIGSSTLQGFSHLIKTNDSGSSLVDYVILDTDGLSWELKPSYRCTINAMKFFLFLQQFIITIDRIDMEGGLVHFLGRDIHFPHGFGPRRDSSCWFKPGVICSGG